MPRIVVEVAVEPAVAALAANDAYELVSCPDARTLLEEVMQRVPDAVVYALHADCREDLGVLRLMRRAAPDVPLVLLAAEDSLETRKLTQALRPIYYAVCPIDGPELQEVLRNAVARKNTRVS